MNSPLVLAAGQALLRVESLTVDFLQHQGGFHRAVNSVSFEIEKESTTALVGESGSGKSVSALAVMGLLPQRQTRISAQSRIIFDDHDLTQLTQTQWQVIRGKRIAMIFQDPMSSLNPVLSIGYQLTEMLMQGAGLSKSLAIRRAVELLTEVGIDSPGKRLKAFPHELSGGQQQRVMIAMALACEPDLLIADEPTTALDVTIQRQILGLLGKLRKDRRMSMLFITHDLGLVNDIADRVVVMQRAEVKESGPVQQIFLKPQHPYTQALLSCRPSPSRSVERLPTIDDWMNGIVPAQEPRNTRARPSVANELHPLLEVTHLRKVFPRKLTWFKTESFVAVEDVSFKLFKGKTLGLVGESGSGKTTIGLMLLRLLEASSGSVWFDGRNLLALKQDEFQQYKKRLQIVFQNPYASLNPRFTVGQLLTEPMWLHGIGNSESERQRAALSLLNQVGLPASSVHRYPFQFSGGQRQRIAIARSLALSPEVLVLDEAVSALDISVQAQVLNLLRDLQSELSLSYLFISHDLAVVRHMSDELIVLQRGKAVEQGMADQIYTEPRHAYTRELLCSAGDNFNQHRTSEHLKNA